MDVKEVELMTQIEVTRLKRFCVARGGILFGKIRGARPISIELAIGKTRSAALYRESTPTLEGTINAGRPAAVTVSRYKCKGYRSASAA